MAAKGEIDASAPFQSVKDAVKLFGAGTFSGGKHAIERPKPGSKERLMAKETKLHLALKGLDILKEKIKNVETTKAEALLELEKAKIVVGDLSDKLRAADESRESATGATEGNQGKQNKQGDSTQKQDLELAMENHTTVLIKLDEKKQELRKICENMRTKEGLDLDSVRAVTSELDVAKESLWRVAEEENGLCRMLESLKLKLKNVQEQHAELIEKERETDAIARDHQAQLQKTKTDLETCLVEGSKASEALGETISTLEMKAEELKKEAKDVKTELRELEEELKATLFEAEETKAAKECGLQRIKGFALSERTDVAETSVSESETRIMISKEKFESLPEKGEEFDKLAETKVAAALAEVDATRACMDEAFKKLEMNQEIKDLQAARIEALKKAETAEGANRAVETELKRWHERVQKKAAEVATRILAETQIPVKSSPHHSRILKMNSAEKLQNSKTYGSKKVFLPSVSGILHQRKNQDEARSAYCLPS